MIKILNGLAAYLYDNVRYKTASILKIFASFIINSNVMLPKARIGSVGKRYSLFQNLKIRIIMLNRHCSRNGDDCHTMTSWQNDINKAPEQEPFFEWFKFKIKEELLDISFHGFGSKIMFNIALGFCVGFYFQ
jgi:hypothetical protein